MLDSRTSAVVILVKHHVKIATGFIDVVQQEVGGDNLPAAIPLGIQFSEQCCRYGVDSARTDHMGIERSCRERDPIELIPRFDKHLRTWVEIRSTFKSAFIPIEESAEIQAKITGDFLRPISENSDSDLTEMVFADRDDEPLVYLEILVETFHDSLRTKLQPVVAFKIDPIGERKYSSYQFSVRIKEQTNLRSRDDAADTQNPGQGV